MTTSIVKGALLYYNLLGFFPSLEINEMFEEKYCRFCIFLTEKK